MKSLDQSVSTLGVPEMDQDHLVIDELFASAEFLADDELPAVLDQIEGELQGHFRREEALMMARGVPLVDCHKAQHRMILGQVAELAKIAPVAEVGALRRLMTTVLRQTVNSHVASIDRVAAAYLTGAIADQDFAGLRLPVSAMQN